MAEVVWAESALTNLIEIAEFIGRDSPTYASAFVARIIDAVDRAALFPRLGRRVPEFGDDLLREMIFQNYRIVYRIDGDVIGIAAVRHGAMLLPEDLPGLPWNLP